jgi:hypothetical protein
MMHECFAIFPDEPSPGAAGTPVAVFDCLEDAMNWGLERFKGGAFRLKYQRLVLLEDGDLQASSGS